MLSRTLTSSSIAGALCLLLSGCVTQPSVPDGYEGGLAQVSDSMIVLSREYAYVFYLEALDGARVGNAFANSSQGIHGPNRMEAVGFTRDVPARTATYTISGRMRQSAPIFALFRNYLSVKGEVELTLLDNEMYIVNGVASNDYAAIWIEDINGARVSEIIEEHNLDAAQLEAQRAALSPDDGGEMTRRARILRVSPGEERSTVEARLGQPDDVTFTEGRVNVWAMRRSADIAVLHYHDLGDITLHDNLVTQVDLSEANLGPEELAVRLRSSNPATIRQEAQRLFRNQESDPEILDLVAQILFDRHLATEAMMVDAMAWLSRVLGNSGNSRYREVLDLVSTEASVRKLRRYAQVARDQLVSDDADGFKPLTQ